MNIKRLLFSILVFLFILNPINNFAQGPGEPFHPMTAPGARGISIHLHILFWENPAGTIYNEVYFSDDPALVSAMDPSVKILDGYPSTVFDSVSLNLYGQLEYYKAYYWKVVEYDSLSFSPSPTWNFTSRYNPTSPIFFFDNFEDGLLNWTITNEGGDCIWDLFNLSSRPYTLPPSATGNVLAADADYCGSGSSTLTTASVTFLTEGLIFGLKIEWDNDWQAISNEDFGYVDISTDQGTTWINITTFDQVDVRNTHEEHYYYFYTSTNNFILRLVSVQPGWDWWWVVDNFKISGDGALTPMLPPGLLKARADTSDLAVNLTWGSGSSPDPIIGYRIQKKNGLPTDASNYVTIAETNSSTFSFIDEGVELNKIYTYHISTLSGPSGGSSIFSNEATAYVPPVVPVELLSFTSSTVDNDITLLWTTATEINNSGFEIEREQVSSPQSAGSNGEWQTIGFIPGHGTTSEKQSYSFKDENLSSGKYLYRLKQIDYDGSFEYSNTIEVEITAPLEFSLEQNYPNPFNPTTKIKYTIPSVTLRQAQSDILVSLKVFDVLGNEVATLVNEFKPAGEYNIDFTAASLPSGVYFYQLKAGEFIQTRKMILLK